MININLTCLEVGFRSFRNYVNPSHIRNAYCLDHNRGFFKSASVSGRDFFEPNRRGVISRNIVDKPWQEHVREGKKIFFQECKLFMEEVQEKFRQDHKKYEDGDTDVFYRFDNEECLKKWRLGSDKINDEGFSECKFTVNDKGKGVFYGNIDTTPPKDGKSRFAGYCGIKSLRKMKSFLREDNFNWTCFTHLELRVRGDGRAYAINLGLGMYFDVNWFDTFSYPMYTRGGPYWETIRIPFSKFFLQSKGRLQDKQEPIPLNKVNSVGITAATVPGPFRLEIDYIGCHMDLSHTEEFAYELYKIPKELVTD